MKTMEVGRPPVSEEARRRVDSATRRDIAFRIKALVKAEDDEAEELAAILIQMLDNHEQPTRTSVIQMLRGRGRSKEAAERLVQFLPA